MASLQKTPFHRQSLEQRQELLVAEGWLSPHEGSLLTAGKTTLAPAAADKMIENVVGVFGLPLGLARHFRVNGRDHLVPMVVEEPSILAALSVAAKLVRGEGGFRAHSDVSWLIGQVQLVDVPDLAAAQRAIANSKWDILQAANAPHPNMVARGGGAKELEMRVCPWRGPAARPAMLVVHLLVDTCDAMGANLVNTMCEAAAPLLAQLSGGRAVLRILSNLCDRSLVFADVVLRTQALAWHGFSGPFVRDAIVLAHDFAAADPYRAATHNKGIMNAVDPIAIATGNDWRAVEASVHAFAARGGTYGPLTQWSINPAGDLVGSIALPLKVAWVGGNLALNPGVQLAQRLLGVQSARELAQVMAAAGLAQNFAALRALATEGIQRGHMALHARAVAQSAGAPAQLFPAVVERLVKSGAIKVWKAQEIIAELQAGASPPAVGGSAAVVQARRPTSNATPQVGVGYGKIILLGEHAVVYGSHALAAPLAAAIEATVADTEQDGVTLTIAPWGVAGRLGEAPWSHHVLGASLRLILDKLKLDRRSMAITVTPRIPRAAGLGGSSALAVALIRALSGHFALQLTDAEVNALALGAEELAHGTPSGIDNTVATYGQFILYKKGEPPLMETVAVPEPLRLCLGFSGVDGLTQHTVARVRAAWQQRPARYEALFHEIDALTLAAVRSLQNYHLAELGELMNICHGLLNAMQVSCPELERLVDIARRNGAYGAKLTGGGGGGAMLALCDAETQERVAAAITQAGFQCQLVQLSQTLDAMARS